MASKGFLWTCTMAAIGIGLMFTRSEAAEDPCKKHEEIRDNYRDVTLPVGTNCDKDLRVGWYRFFLDGDSASMPTQCMKPGVCGTLIGMYANLKGASMPSEGETIRATACGSYNILDHWSCCALQQPIRIKHCPGGFYVYHLKPTDRCAVGYCAIKDPVLLDGMYTVRHGYHIDYKETTPAKTTTQQIETTEETTIQDIEETTMSIQTTDEMNGILMSTETTQKVDMTTLPSMEDIEKDILDSVLSSSGDDIHDHDSSPELSTSSDLDKQKATTIQSNVIPATTTRSVPIFHGTHIDKFNRDPAELIFLLNGHDKEEVLASFRANFTAAMQRANRNIHNITVKELCPIGDAVKILFWAYDKQGNLIPGVKVEENMEMREKVEEALGLRPIPQRQDIFQEYLALFIILIIIGFLCLIILLSSCMYLYCRRHSGHWDRALAEQYHVTVVPRREARIAESPFSDEAIMSDEILEKSHSSLGSHYPGVGNLHDLSYPNSLSGIKAMNNKNSFNTYPNSYGSLPKDGIEGLVVPIDQVKPEKDTLIIEDTVL